MKIACVTLTGADDDVNPKKLEALSKEFPFVEWGILFSQSKSGVERYPSPYWVNKLHLLEETNFSAHLCGKLVDIAISGEINVHEKFQRVQLNLTNDKLKRAMKSEALNDLIATMSQKVIFGGKHDSCSCWDRMASPLFDASGGNGLSPIEWPLPFKTNNGETILNGYAGGLGPENINDELHKLAKINEESVIWIDMESRIRTDGKFDLDKCKQVLETVKAWM
jgi:phosphoribosylanthranilate isomerase